MDEQPVDRHAADAAGWTSQIDICVNAVGMDMGDQGMPLVMLSAREFLNPISAYLRTNFRTARAAARHVLVAGAGVILSVSPPMSRNRLLRRDRLGWWRAPTEAMCRQLALELGPSGVRVWACDLTVSRRAPAVLVLIRMGCGSARPTASACRSKRCWRRSERAVRSHASDGSAGRQCCRLPGLRPG
ncbi:SDR family oxidoreductase [Actinomadura sp. NPDC023710]|uniref:SDR family oxidoreductase n=1 Tax=Actinomadura sp. NPDC023710 TaxID=3158219 RepID=UPI0033E8B6C1